MIHLYNTLTRKIEKFTPHNKKTVSLYTCGPTVYNYVHIGNLRTFIFEDILKRTLLYHGYKVNHVMNITDVGHLTDDADRGEDKMEKGSKREGKSAWDIAELYTKAFKKDLEQLNILEPTIWSKATDHIPEQINQVQQLIDGGYAYETSDGIYFDTTKLKDYGKLAQLEKQSLKAGVRVDLGEKKNHHDFALWKFSGAEESRQMEWDAFGKKGFPGWHIECSAMAMKYLGDTIDIHCGGIDLIPVHHTNEIAQAEAISGKKPWVTYWLHGAFVNMDDGEKMSKSKDGFIQLATLVEKGVEPLAYRYLTMQTHYRKELQFSWDALQGAEHSLERLYATVRRLSKTKPSGGAKKYEETFLKTISDDLNMPEALAVVWGLLKSDEPDENKLASLLKFDKVLGFGLQEIIKEKIVIPKQIKTLLAERKQAREEKNWDKADELRDQISDLGFKVEDTDEGQEVLPE